MAKMDHNMAAAKIRNLFPSCKDPRVIYALAQMIEHITIEAEYERNVTIVRERMGINQFGEGYIKMELVITFQN